MLTEISTNSILQLLVKQLDNLFTCSDLEAKIIKRYFEEALWRCEKCFERNSNKYYKKNGEVFFSPFNTVQYMFFLYYFSNTIYKNSGCGLCDKIYYLNKVLNAVDILYAVELPDFCMAEHPIGSVIGRASISDGFMFFQNCTVGGTKDRSGCIHYPVFGGNCILYANSAVLGSSVVGSNCSIAAGALVKNEIIPSNSIVFGQSPNLIIKTKPIDN